MENRSLLEDQSSGEAQAPERTAWDQPATSKPPVQTGREPAIGQLEAIIENLTTYAAPVLREIAARAAELAAKAADAAGPFAQKAAEKTEHMSERLATKGREVASDLRRDPTGVVPAGDPSAGRQSQGEDADLPPQ